MQDIIIETLVDGIKLIPFLFFAFLIIEILEHKITNKSKEMVSKAGKVGPLLGGFLGIFPQCGFSVMATNLYITRVVSLGTLIAIYLSTSDEMLPIMLSENVSFAIILQLLLIKLFIGIVCGFFIDFILRKTKKSALSYQICADDHCHCERGVFISALSHTFKILIFILIISFVLNILLEFFDETMLSTIFLKNSLFGPFIASLIGLIPNCGASVMITELYINNAISLGSTMAGLLTGSGVALLVLFKTNKNIKENLMILALIYSIGVIGGILIEIITNLL